MNARALFSLYLYFVFTYFNIFCGLANHSRESIQRPRHFCCLFSTLFQSGAIISNNGGDIFSIFFRIFYQSRLFRFFTIAGYFTSETIMALSGGNGTTLFIQKQGTNETQHIYFAADVKQH